MSESSFLTCRKLARLMDPWLEGQDTYVEGRGELRCLAVDHKNWPSMREVVTRCSRRSSPMSMAVARQHALLE